MPPLPIYLINFIANAFAIISACIITAKRFAHAFIIDALNKTEQLALTFDVENAINGIRIIETINPTRIGNALFYFSMAYALIFSLLCLVFTIICFKYQKSNSIE